MDGIMEMEVETQRLEIHGGKCKKTLICAKERNVNWMDKKNTKLARTLRRDAAENQSNTSSQIIVNHVQLILILAYNSHDSIRIRTRSGYKY